MTTLISGGPASVSYRVFLSVGNKAAATRAGVWLAQCTGTGSGCPAHPTRAEGHEELRELRETCREAGPWGLEGRLQGGPPGTQDGVCHGVRTQRLACNPKDLHSTRVDQWLSLTREISGAQWGWGQGALDEHVPQLWIPASCVFRHSN